ncbi:MAG: hypothetical protein AB7Q27_21300, partial [Acidimicrobiia bacterium]
AMFAALVLVGFGLRRRVARRDPTTGRGGLAIGMVAALGSVAGMLTVGILLVPFAVAFIWIAQPLHELRRVELAPPNVGVRT